MLVKVSVENFKSFDSPVELTMISSGKIQDHKDHRITIKSTNILKHAVIYGANASGKSNLVDFFSLFKRTVQKEIPLEAVEWYCKNREENKAKKSSFEIEFTLDGKFYAYGFSAILNERKIVDEWLYELYQDGSFKRLFEREPDKCPVFDDTIRLNSVEKKRFEVYAEDFKGNTTNLFLSEMNRGKKYSDKSKLLFFQNVYRWFRSNLYVIHPDTPLIEFAELQKQEQAFHFDPARDKIIAVFDADIFEKNSPNYGQVLAKAQEYNDIVAVTNPAFELFLLLHYEGSFESDIVPNAEDILQNRKENNKTFIYRLLFQRTKMNSKTNQRIGDLAMNVDVAIEQEQKLNQDIDQCHGKLTCNIGKIISDIRSIKAPS